MGLFDHLFKSKSPPHEEKVAESVPEGGGPAKSPDSPGRTPLPHRADPSAFLHPKNYVPRGAPALTPAPRPGPASAVRPPERRQPASAPVPAADEIVLTLGDVLSRIPTHCLKPGVHDAKRELRFKINDLSSDIARGRAAVPLSRIAQLVPDIFAREISREEDTEVRLPLQKLVEQIGLLRSRPKSTLPEKTVGPGVSAGGSTAPRILDVEAKKESLPPAAVAGATAFAADQSLRPTITPLQAPQIILGEKALGGQKSVELKPAGEPVAPVILGPVVAPAPAPSLPVSAPVAPSAAPEPLPAPVVTVPVTVEVPPPREEPRLAAPAPPAAPVVPAPAVSSQAVPSQAIPVQAIPVQAIPVQAIPAPAAEPMVLATPPVPAAPVAPVTPTLPPEPPPSIAPTPVVAPKAEPTVSRKSGIVIDWTADTPAILPPKTPEAKVPETIVETVRHEPPPGEHKLAPLESPELEPGEERIQLNLAAILRHCPPEIVVGQLPHVDDSVRISLPFAPIDRQLVKGQVEVSALRFIAALPEPYQKYFIAKVGVKVPIPLEEVFQNLPSPTQELASAPLVPVPVVLAPATVAPESIGETEEPAAAPLEPLAAATAPTAPAVSTPTAPEPPRAAEVAAAAAGLGILAAAGLAREHAAVPPVVKAEAPQPKAEPAPVPSEPVPVPVSPAVEEVPVPVSPASGIGSTAPVPQSAAPAPLVVEPPAEAVLPAASTPIEEVPEAVAKAPSELAATVLPSEPAPTPTPAEPAAETGTTVHKLVLQRQVLRSFVVPPPPIFGATPPPAAAAPEAEPPPRVEPPPLIASLMASPVVDPGAVETPAPPSEPVAPAEPMAVVETPVSLPVAETKLEVVPPRPDIEAEATPTSEQIASAPEDGAPEKIIHFPVHPIPFADLSEIYAHETTYAAELAEAVQIPGQEPVAPAASAEVEASKPAEEPAVHGVEAKTVETPAAEPDVEPPTPPAAHASTELAEAAVGVAATAIGAITLEAIGHKKPEAASVGEPQEVSAKDSSVPAGPVEPGQKPEQPPVGEAGEQLRAPEPVVEAHETAAETPSAPVEEPPAAPEPEPAAAAIPTPLFPLPKLPSEPAHLEILPPPSLPLRRFDQDAIQALFMTEEALDLPKISRLAASLPGVYACVIATRDQACTGGTLPDGFDLAALLGLAPRVGEAAHRMPIGQLKHFTLYGDAYSVSFFERNGLSLCAVHRPRSFVPGVREKLVALADELSH